jgi:hypothetical protein
VSDDGAAPGLSSDRPLRVAVMGAGPPAVYTAEPRTRQDAVSVVVDLVDRLPTPFDLLRHGIAVVYTSGASVDRRLASRASSCREARPPLTSTPGPAGVPGGRCAAITGAASGVETVAGSAFAWACPRVINGRRRTGGGRPVTGRPPPHQRDLMPSCYGWERSGSRADH